MVSGAFALAGLAKQGRGRFIFKIDIGQLSAGAVLHDEAGFQLID